MPWNEEVAPPPENRGGAQPRIGRLLVRVAGVVAIIAATLKIIDVWTSYAAYPDCPLPQIRIGLWRAAMHGPLWLTLGGVIMILLSLRSTRK